MVTSEKSDKPVGSAALNTTTANPTVNDSMSLPLSDRAPLAGESSDPTVHQLLAEKQAHQMNRDEIDPPVVDKKGLADVDELIADVDDQLEQLGFPQQSQADRKAGLQKAAADAAKKDEDAAQRRADRAEAREAAVK